MLKMKFAEGSDAPVIYYRLSVIPEKRGLGIAKELLKSLEDYAVANVLSYIYCRVRMTVPRNIHLYRSLGYSIVKEELIHKPDGIRLGVVTMMKG